MLVVGLLVWVLTDDDTYVAPSQVPPAAAGEKVSPALAATALRQLEAAVRARDRDAAADLAPDGDLEAASLLEGVVDNAREARVEDFSLRYVDEVGAAGEDGAWSAAVDTTWAFAGFDEEPATTEVVIGFVREGDEARVASIGGGGRRSPVWLAGPADVRRTPRTLVIAAEGQDASAYAGLAREAVPDVLAVLPEWDGGLVVEVPRSQEALHEVLAATPGTYDSIAAVTTSVDGTFTPTSPVHVVVNPRLFGTLEPQGAQVVMSHEAVHVATDAATGAQPLWLLEGFADYVALRDVPLPLTTTAAQVIKQIRREGPPDALPGPDEFDTTATHLGAAYEAAWLVCRVLAGIGGEERLVDFYFQVAAGSTVDEALREQFGISEAELTEQWSDYLAGLA